VKLKTFQKKQKAPKRTNINVFCGSNGQNMSGEATASKKTQGLTYAKAKPQNALGEP
jgi:hypothetical protein